MTLCRRTQALVNGKKIVICGFRGVVHGKYLVNKDGGEIQPQEPPVCVGVVIYTFSKFKSTVTLTRLTVLCVTRELKRTHTVGQKHTFMLGLSQVQNTHTHTHTHSDAYANTRSCSAPRSAALQRPYLIKACQHS